MNATTLPILDLARYADPAEKAAFLADLPTPPAISVSFI